MRNRTQLGLDEIMIVNPSPGAGQAVRLVAAETTEMVTDQRREQPAMATVKGIREKLHMPLYDSIFVGLDEATRKTTTLTDLIGDGRVMRFFVDVQRKTRLDTNMQAASTLSHYNTFEAYAMRAVVSPSVSRDSVKDLANKTVTAPKVKERIGKEEFSSVFADEFEAQATGMASQIVNDVIYRSVTSLIVGEKTMIEMPTFWFPAGAGVSTNGFGLPTNGQPDPMATFRFAEPVFIDKQQNFRVEVSFPTGVPASMMGIGSQYRIWVILDGYLTRDVQ